MQVWELQRCWGPGAPGDRRAWPVITPVLRDSARVTPSPRDLPIVKELSRINPWSKLCTHVPQELPALLSRKVKDLPLDCGIREAGETVWGHTGPEEQQRQRKVPFLTHQSNFGLDSHFLDSIASQSHHVLICEMGLDASLQLHFLNVLGTGVRQQTWWTTCPSELVEPASSQKH